MKIILYIFLIFHCIGNIKALDEFYEIEFLSELFSINDLTNWVSPSTF
jgi:hypothetical protein